MENQKQSTRQDVPLAPLFHTVLAAHNKTSELFVKSFQYQGENIATKHLGQIFGFFEIPDTHEDNAYIVNFLASVVKKEYFVNPKRSAGDAFEAALHKVNLALAELVRQGNTGWLGKLHGVVSVIAENTFHFSVTGDAAIILYRDGQASLISEGLADKDAALHPLKTFLEISSGVLLPEDKILVTSPELLTLCEEETLRKNAFRMDKNGFARYVRAALVNESPLGVSLIIDLEAAPIVVPPKKSKVLQEKSEAKLQNVFSGTAFTEEKVTEKEQAVESVEPIEREELPPREYTDSKTGHIYVQGESHSHLYKEPNGWQLFIEETLKPALASFLLFLKRLGKKSRKNMAKKAALLSIEGKELSKNLWERSKTTGSSLATRSTEAFKNGVHTLKKEPQKTPVVSAPETEIPDIQREEQISSVSSLPPVDTELPESFTEESDTSKRRRALERFSPHYEWQKTPSPESSPLTYITTRIQSGIEKVFSFLKNISPKQKIIVGSVVAGIIAIFLLLSLFNNLNPEEKATETSPSPVPTSEPEASAPTPTQLADATTRATWTEGSGLVIAIPEDTPFVVTPKAIITPEKTTPFPLTGSIETATYMPDLKMLFLWSSNKELVSWNIVDQKFTANTFPLPANTKVSALGAYLTYLYAVDKEAGTIHRFARIEGGFNEPTSWLKSPLPKDSIQAFTVNETIRIATPTSIDQYLRGNKEKTLAQNTYQVLSLSHKQTYTLGVDTTTGKLTVWDADGNQVYEGTHEELKDIQALGYHEDDHKLYVTQGQNLKVYSLKW